MVSEKRQLAHEQIDLRIEGVKSALAEASAPIELQNKALHLLQLCKKRIDNTDSIPQIISEQTEAESHEDDAYEQINRHIESRRKKETVKPVTAPGENNGDGNKITDPKVIVLPPKRTVTISAADILANQANTAFIETEVQIEQYINQLRDKLLNAVRDGDRVRIK